MSSRPAVSRPFLLLALLLGVPALSIGQGDYIAADLRARVEELKGEASQSSTSPQVLLDRLDTLWAWANAYALDGGRLPIDFTMQYTLERLAARSISPSPSDALLVDLAGAFEDYVRGIPELSLPSMGDREELLRSVGSFVETQVAELTLKEEHPNALGTLRLEPNQAQRAGTMVTLEQTWTVGDVPMRVGGGIALTSRGRWGSLQTTDATAQGYTSVRSSRAGARLVPSEPWAKWTSFITRFTLQWRLEGAELRPGDTVTVTYGDRSGGGPGFRVHSYSNDAMVLPVHLDLEAEGHVLQPTWPSFPVIGAEETCYVDLVAPSVVAAGEDLALTLRGQDCWKNVSSGESPAYRVLLGETAVATLAAGGPGLQTIEDVRLPEPGIYRFEVRSEDGRLRGGSNPVWVEAAPERRVLWGDTHGHSGFAEGQGQPEGYYRFGRDVARLDFLSLSEHDIFMDDGEWQALRDAVDRFNDPGRFTALLGYEWTALVPFGGHHNVFFADAEAGRKRVPVQTAPVLSELYQGLRKAYQTDDVLVIPHAHQAADWRQSDGDLERLIEITSGHGTFGFFGDKYLANGFKVGFIGSTDNHNGHPGYTGIGNQQLGGLAAVLAPENTTPALFSAMRARSTYATTGERILLDADLDGYPMGAVVEPTADRTLRLRVSGTTPIDNVDVVKNGQVIYRRSFLGEPQGVGSTARVQLRFESSSEVFNGHRNPRGPRPWKGSVRVEGAHLVGFDEPWFAHPDTFHLRRSTTDAEALDFSFRTRGRSKSLVVDLEDASGMTELVIDVSAAREISGSPGAVDREPVNLPSIRLSFGLDELAKGPVGLELPVVRNIDRIEARLVPSGAALDVDMEFRDQTRVAAGDVYYLRVRQLDGGVAWSSPWFVGAANR